MDYRPKKIDNKKEEFFAYEPRQQKNKRLKNIKKISKDNPFEKLSEIKI